MSASARRDPSVVMILCAPTVLCDASSNYVCCQGFGGIVPDASSQLGTPMKQEEAVLALVHEQMASKRNC
eukprot:3384156-Amphidinium_carterae.1